MEKIEVYREACNVYVGNQSSGDRETIVYYSDRSFSIINSNEQTKNEERLYDYNRTKFKRNPEISG
ncbi:MULTISPECIES: hypothetical protein [Bacillus]|uniref:hypothetical protein n=1 Tax=Bacillus TaxID=1386 RepID=UPI001112C5D0|nr:MULTISPECIES: hypothetical protein [Bacillus]QCY61406.1 hypothetical protein FHE73_11620 [Bacillus thuringiensis]